MKFIFLFLAILLAMEPVVSEEECWMKGKCRLVCKNDEDSVTRCSNRKRRHMLRCMGDLGICRPACRQSEEPYLYCRNYQSCCLPSYVRIDISGKEGKNDWSRENRWPKVS
ncbi:beta-defensin 119 isoform X1 [Cervus canadensis]|uniref:beta-defensin 119 isoform X1 n=1 Tax=Cervus canadensis TaxID=1574408 RepID=UPI001C9E3E39|nr:beta-defensin 119 isoform X1 [Cervus canadensis]